MATKKKATSASRSAVGSTANHLNGKANQGRASGTAESRDTARLLLDIEAIHCRPENPYIFTSGRASPVYIDCRKIISYPEARAKIMQHALKAIDRDIGWSKIDVVAGGETAGIPFAAFLAALAKKPMIYVRKQPKGFGRLSQIEGVLDPGRRVVLVEDLTTDGKSKINFCAAIKRAGAVVDHAVVVFYYGVYPDAEANLAEAGIVLHALTDWKTTLEVAEARGYFDAEQVKVVREFLADPPRWSKAHGGV